MKSGCGKFGWCTFMKLMLMKNGCPWRAAWLGVVREESHAFICHSLEVRRRHTAPGTSAVRRGVAVTEIVGHDQDDVGFLLLRSRRRACRHQGSADSDRTRPDRC